MNFKLTVVHSFGDYAKGAVITDQATVSQILAEHEARVVKSVMTDEEVAALTAPAPSPAADPEPAAPAAKGKAAAPTAAAADPANT